LTDGVTISFVFASPLINPVILSMLWVMLGWKACVVYFVVMFIVGGAGMSIHEMSMLAGIFKK
jgi:uncharacterized membrane protein YraQ (UPF0718 family)